MSAVSNLLFEKLTYLPGPDRALFSDLSDSIARRQTVATLLLSPGAALLFHARALRSPGSGRAIS
jgi:hypothetical protein